jgi:ferric-dicitrate binding protein FerR (iron transport regulator)
MKEADIDRIIADFLSGNISDEDHEQLEAWKQASKANRESLELLGKVASAGHQRSRMLFAEDSFRNILTRAQKPTGFRILLSDPLTRSILKVAATLLLVAAAAFALNYFAGFPAENTENTHQETFVVKSTLSGQKSKIFLPDGSSLWLNAASKIRYQTDFNDSIRKVFLEGEAYFTVRKDASRPFVVEANNTEVTALGTEFNVNAYPEWEQIRVSLSEGIVRVRKLDHEMSSDNAVLLHPGEMATIPRNENHITKTNFDPLKMVAWKDGVIYFKDADFEEITHTLEKWYGVRFVYDRPPDKEWVFSGKFENDYLDNILIILSFSEDFEYDIIGDTVKLNL